MITDTYIDNDTVVKLYKLYCVLVCLLTNLNMSICFDARFKYSVCHLSPDPTLHDAFVKLDLRHRLTKSL